MYAAFEGKMLAMFEFESSDGSTTLHADRGCRWCISCSEWHFWYFCIQPCKLFLETLGQYVTTGFLLQADALTKRGHRDTQFDSTIHPSCYYSYEAVGWFQKL